MRGYELLGQVMSQLKEKLPQVYLRECWVPGGPGRLPQKPVLAGQVGQESQEEDKWSARLDFTLYLPRGMDFAAGEGILAAAIQSVEGVAGLAGFERQGFTPDTSTGLMMAACSFNFAGGGGVQGQTVSIGGIPQKVSGWQVSVSPGRALTAIGEEEPFAWVGGVTYTVALTGLDTQGLERLAGFTVELGGQVYMRCRWKTLEETRKGAVFLSNRRLDRGDLDGGA